MRQTIAYAPVLSTAAILCVTATLAAPAAAPGPEQAEAPRVDVHTIKETRRVDLVKAGEPMGMFEQPGLVLTCAVTLPAQRKLVDVFEPTSLTATDSSGRDLTRVEADFMGERDHVQVVQRWEEPCREFELRLAPAARTATTFTLSARCDALTYTGTKNVTVEVPADFKPLDEKLFGKAVQARLAKGGAFGGSDQGVQVTFRPGTMRDAIEKITLTDGTNLTESNSSMWNDEEVTFYFDCKHSPQLKAALTVRTGIETTPLTVELKSQALP